MVLVFKIKTVISSQHFNLDMSYTFLIQFFKRKIKKMKVSKFLQQKKKSATKYQTRISTLAKLKILLPDCLFTNSLTHLVTE